MLHACWGAWCSCLSGAEVSIGLAVQTDLVGEEMSDGHKVTAKVLGTLQTLINALWPASLISLTFTMSIRYELQMSAWLDVSTETSITKYYLNRANHKC